MDTERKSLHATVREGYQILLRADADYLLPVGRENIRAFYESLVDTCLKWVLEVHGEGLRREFLALESVREKSQFRTQRYRLLIGKPYSDDTHTAFLCESWLTGQWKSPQEGYRRSAQVWNAEEETLLPAGEILSRFGMRLKTGMLPFRPHGIYPEGDEMVFFRNASDRARFCEVRLARNGSGEEQGVEKDGIIGKKM